MRRFFINQKSAAIDDVIVIQGDEARHIGKVLRLAAHDTVMLFDTEGVTYTGIITHKTNGEIAVRVISKVAPGEQDASKVILAQAVTKAQKMDFIVQKSTELGVSKIIPFFSSRCIPKWDSRTAENKARHWQNIVTASVKQSGIRAVPVVEQVALFSEVLAGQYAGFLKFILWEKERENSLKRILSAGTFPQKIIFAVGPEGGFSGDEIAQAQEKGFIPVGLGNYILRAETAPVAVMSIIRYESGELG
ncbi:MAG: 16S rRNA (uracil(1498)-N(3))-methyltransferase [Pseudomonadota bacterium]